MIWITRIESTQSRVLCYWNMSEVKEGKLKYNKERIRTPNNVTKQKQNEEN